MIDRDNPLSYKMESQEFIMHFKMKNPYGSYGRQEKKGYSISEALMHSMEDSGYGHGIEDRISTNEASLNKTSFMLASLIQALHDKGVLSDDDIIGMLDGYTFERIDDV
jgi:hypothetical protein